MNSYLAVLLSAQRQSDLQAEARDRHLAHEVRAAHRQAPALRRGRHTARHPFAGGRSRLVARTS